MACNRERSDQLAALAAGRLDEAGAAELFEHVEGCGACSEELDAVADLVYVAQEGRALDAEEPRGHLLAFAGWTAAAAAAVLLLVLALRPGAGGGDVTELATLDPLLPAAGFVARSGLPVTEEAAYGEALDLYANGDFAAAAERLATLSADPPDALVELYLGISLLQTEDWSGATAALERASDIGEGLLAERAQWYLANAHLAAGRAKEARTVLERIVAQDGDYEPNAREKLAALARALGE